MAAPAMAARRRGRRRPGLAVTLALAGALAARPCGGVAAADAGPGGDEGTCDAASGSCASSSSDLRWEPRTISVVLPCAGEGDFAKKTVESVANSIPGGAGGGILENIVVVDDGSKPPLRDEMPEDWRNRYGVKLVRHDKSRGLIKAKSAGASRATGDLIIFFDCHVAPQKTWYEEFLRASAENWKRVVVPRITDLDIDTWTEKSRSNSVSKCYLTWDADFKWLQTESDHIPILSGGLLGISRRWWNETGGYDSSMRDWGGENIDQSLRTWLCGGEIVALPNAAVAHMWRKPDDTRTKANYEISPLNALRNRARAALGWFDNFTAKLDEYNDMVYIRQQPMNVDVFHEVRDRIGCRPFAWFLWRFRDIYEAGGLLPQETFQIQHVRSKKCLTFDGPPGTHPQGMGKVLLHTCDVPYRNTRWPMVNQNAQRWHAANQIPGKSGECCSGFRVWNTDQCLAVSQYLGTVVCDVMGRSDQLWRLTDESDAPLVPGQLLFRQRCLAKMKDDLVPGECKKLQDGVKAVPMWKKVSFRKPLETELYEAALRDRPDLFTS